MDKALIHTFANNINDTCIYITKEKKIFALERTFNKSKLTKRNDNNRQPMF